LNGDWVVRSVCLDSLKERKIPHAENRTTMSRSFTPLPSHQTDRAAPVAAVISLDGNLISPYVWLLCCAQNWRRKPLFSCEHVVTSCQIWRCEWTSHLHVTTNVSAFIHVSRVSRSCVGCTTALLCNLWAPERTKQAGRQCT